MVDREEFIEQQTSRIYQEFALTSGEEDSRDRLRQLAIETYDFLISGGAAYVCIFYASPESAFNPKHQHAWGLDKRDSSSRVELAPELMQRWKSWSREYFEIR